VVETIKKNSTTRQLSTQEISNIVNKSLDNTTLVSACMKYKILTSLGYGSYKPTYKPGLTRESKARRLQFRLAHKDRILEDWKNIVWTDETALTMSGQRGIIRVSRLHSEAYNQHCIRRRWKGFKQFMFRGSFSCDKKGPCYVWQEKTTKEKNEAEEWINRKNQ
jgi:hypothetical protein